MPLYEVNHTIPLSSEEQSLLAERITYIHTRLFKAPSLFVNVVFKNVTNVVTFVAGKRCDSNVICANVRPDGRSRESFNEMCKKVDEAWKEIVKPSSRLEELRTIFVLGTIVAGYEAGFTIPKAGEEKAWITENMAGFEKKAADGDELFVDMLKELKEREDLKE